MFQLCLVNVRMRWQGIQRDRTIKITYIALIVAQLSWLANNCLRTISEFLPIFHWFFFPNYLYKLREIAEIWCRNTKTNPARNLFLLRMCPWIINIANFTCVYEQSSKYFTVSFVFFSFGRGSHDSKNYDSHWACMKCVLSLDAKKQQNSYRLLTTKKCIFHSLTDRWQ